LGIKRIGGVDHIIRMGASDIEGEIPNGKGTPCLKARDREREPLVATTLSEEMWGGIKKRKGGRGGSKITRLKLSRETSVTAMRRHFGHKENKGEI